MEAFQNNIPKKQSIDTIIHTNGLNISTSTAYRYIRDHQIPGIANIDLKRQVRYTQRSSSRHHPISITMISSKSQIRGLPSSPRNSRTGCKRMGNGYDYREKRER